MHLWYFSLWYSLRCRQEEFCLTIESFSVSEILFTLTNSRTNAAKALAGKNLTKKDDIMLKNDD